MSGQAGRPAGVTTRRGFLAATVAGGVGSLSGCIVDGQTEDFGPSPGAVSIAGSSTVYPVSKALAEEYFKRNPDAEITVSSTGTGAGFSNFFCARKTDVNDASRAITESERELCADSGVTPIEFRVATDALTVIVNPQNDWVECLSLEELRTIWGPENPPQTWSDVHSEWPTEDMNLLGPTAASGTFDFFTEAVMGEEGVHRTDYQKTEQDNAVVTAVARDRYAMAYLGFAYYVENRDRLKGVPVKNEAGECVEPTFDTAKRGAYPLSRPLYIYVAKESLADPAVRRFVRFYIEQSRSDLVKRVGYVPVTDDLARENLDRLDDAIQEVTA